MTFELVLNSLLENKITVNNAVKIISEKNMMRRINFYVHFDMIQKDPLNDSQLQELRAIVNILQIIYNSDVESPVSDSDYDILQETLVDMGIPRLTGSYEINDNNKVSHTYTTLRGTLDKVYYLTKDEKRTNKSRKYLDEWIKSCELKYKRVTGKEIKLDDEKIAVTCKLDGTSAILEWDGKKAIWLTRGDTAANRASDVSHIMRKFNDLYCGDKPCGIKFEVMCSEESKNKINEFYRDHPYRNSRQVVTSTLNTNEPDFKVDYLYPVPLRIIYPGEKIESLHDDLLKKLPSIICRLSDRETIRNFANNHRLVDMGNFHLRTDGAVITILNPKVQEVLGRENNINKFEVGYKFTEETAYARVKDVEFYLSEFGIITPVLVIYPVVLKGNTISKISLANKERFDELQLCYNDQVLIHYDIIPYVTIDETCHREPHGRKIQFIRKCPRCHEDLELNTNQVQCMNMNCPSRIIGKILNYCANLRIQNIGYSTLETLYNMGYLKHGIRSLYKLKKKSLEIQDLDGFGKLRTKKMINEIEAKRKLYDYEFFGALGIQTLSMKLFQAIFNEIKLEEFLNLIKLKNFELLLAKLLVVNGMGPGRSEVLVKYFKDLKNVIEINKLLEEINLVETYNTSNDSKGLVTFSGCRPSVECDNYLKSIGYIASDVFSSKTKYLVIPRSDFESGKVNKAKNKKISIISLDERNQIDVLKQILESK